MKKKYTKPEQLDKYAFLWSQARLVIAAVALFLGGTPPFIAYSPSSLIGTLSSLHAVAYLISGVAAIYMVYRWNQSKQKLFGHKNKIDLAAFFVSIVSGVNLGLVGLLGKNIGMSITSSYPIFILVGIIYLISMMHLQKRWNHSGQKMFS
ncbi:MAG: hypothetical protein COT81_03595 [Candidatus Buchananbacteria bacterium CG10_big_fil_rev_8_21_14_0_10_42_9]|uniref:Uncharacterized protein n=1 Tax=Candidatus Buchananbacteria bacterium CG10_big_fil_rev_8_21_14_0_10_42_9 TaxID=1974526 RepID=A0A2H0W376_9BACT|nr:MAG: hypothetical protein COT81_03595 [Candidatus Buchananbacteria bacterium CG10_big_fil_rev_8_21_14_0_10_42_9]